MAPPANRAPVALHVAYLHNLQIGYASRMLEEMRLLTRLGVRVHLASFFDPRRTSDAQAAELARAVRGFADSEVHLLPTRSFFDLAFANGADGSILEPLLRLVQRIRPDVMHGQAMYSTIHALRARHRCAIPVVFDVHGYQAGEQVLAGSQSTRARTISDWERDALHRSDMRIYVSHGMAGVMQQTYGIDAPWLFVPCCVDLAKFERKREAREPTRTRLRLEGRIVITYVGTLAEWQWPEALFAVCAQLLHARQDASLLLIVPSSDHARAREWLERQRIPPDRVVLTAASHDAVPELLSAGDVGLLLRLDLPLSRVASPIKYGEYLAAGVPVLGMGTIGDVRPSQDETGTTIAPSASGLDAQQLARVLAWFDEVPTRRAELAERCRAFARTNLDWAKFGARIVGTYRELGRRV